MRALHRSAAVFLVFFTLYLAVTGSGIQLIDIATLLRNAPATNTNVQAIRESEDGPNNYVVIAVGDYTAPAMPDDFDYAASLAAALHNAREAAGANPFKYVEWRVQGSQPIVQIKIPAQRVMLNAGTGRLLGAVADHPGGGGTTSAHNAVKAFHRGNVVFGDWTLVLGMIVGTGLILMIVTGLVVWGKLYADRVRGGRYNPFWGAGSRWRRLHRGIALVAAVFLLLIAFTGTWLEFDSLWRGVLVARSTNQVGKAHALDRWNQDASSPLHDADLPAMLATTLASFHHSHPAAPIKVLRLRDYASYAQGVVVAGGSETTQLVYNARTGAAMSESEAGYPPTYFPFGWQLHETLKKVHRGDYFGLTGRVMSALSSFALIYLSISGIEMYLDLLGRRRRVGRKALLWS